MLISLCIPCHARTQDLKRTWPYLLAAANASPPVEIAVLDYNSPDDLRSWIREAWQTADLCNVQITYRRYVGRSYFHKAHAFNLAMMSGHGDVLCLLGTDAVPAPGYVRAVRELVKAGAVWGHGPDVCGIIFCRREEFITAGGYDERFEFYGPEDRDLNERLERRGSSRFGLVPKGLMSVLPTPDVEKVAHFRLPLTKAGMSQRMRPVYEENQAAGLLVANQDRGWGRWV